MSTVQACPVNRNTPLRSPNCTSSFRKKWGYTEELFCGFRAASSLQAAKIKFLACGTGSVRVPLVAQFDVAGRASSSSFLRLGSWVEKTALLRVMPNSKAGCRCASKGHLRRGSDGQHEGCKFVHAFRRKPMNPEVKKLNPDLIVAFGLGFDLDIPFSLQKRNYIQI